MSTDPVIFVTDTASSHVHKQPVFAESKTRAAPGNSGAKYLTRLSFYRLFKPNC